MSQMVTRVVYEWDHESVDDYGDIIDHDFSDAFPGFPTEDNVELVLVRNEFRGLSGKDFNDSCDLDHRSWAYVKDGVLPETFDDGTPVPKKFFKHFKGACK